MWVLAWILDIKWGELIQLHPSESLKWHLSQNRKKKNVLYHIGGKKKREREFYPNQEYNKVIWGYIITQKMYHSFIPSREIVKKTLTK